MAEDATGSGEAEAFYRSLQGVVRVGIEATGPIHWFVRLLTELGHELWIGDSAKIRASEVRKQNERLRFTQEIRQKCPRRSQKSTRAR
jgi:transposase